MLSKRDFQHHMSSDDINQGPHISPHERRIFSALSCLLIGATTLSELKREMVSTTVTRALTAHINAVPKSHTAQLYERLDTAVGVPSESAKKLEACFYLCHVSELTTWQTIHAH